MQMAKIPGAELRPAPVVAYLCASALRGLRDYRILGGMIIVAACIKALMPLYVAHGHRAQ